MLVQCSERLYSVNKNILFPSFRDGVRYLYIEKDGESIPYFIKNEYINILEKLGKKEFAIDKIKHLYGESVIDALIEKKFIIAIGEEPCINKEDLADQKRLSRYNRKLTVSRTPLVAKFEVTYKCNYKCEYCYVDADNYSNYQYLAYKDIKRILDELKAVGVVNLFITGGEPLKHPEIVQILKYADELGFILTLQTNGALITEELAQILRNLRHFSIGISFHSHDSNEFDEFTRVNGSYLNTIRAIDIMKKNYIRFVAKLTVTSHNKHSVLKTIQYFENNNIPFEIYTQILPNVSDSKSTTDFICDYDIIKDLYTIGAIKFRKSMCSALITKCWISPNGDVYPCELVRTKIGNLLEADFNIIWENEKSNEILNSDLYSQPDQCMNCKNEKYCTRCLAYLNYDNWKSGLSQFCMKAEIISNLE